MFKRILMGAGVAWLARKFMGGGRHSHHSRGVGSRFNRRGIFG